MISDREMQSRVKQHSAEVAGVHGEFQKACADVASAAHDDTLSNALDRKRKAGEKLMSMLTRHASEWHSVDSRRYSHQRHMSLSGAPIDVAPSEPGGNPLLDTAKQMSGTGAED